MNVYLDIDKTILHNDGTPVHGLRDFLEYLLSNHTVYWLTSHCGGETEHLEAYLDRYIADEEILSLCAQIRPTDWNVLKTDAIDFSQPFVWIDDYALETEKKVLEKHDALGRWIQVDLRRNPQHLTEIMKVI